MEFVLCPHQGEGRINCDLTLQQDCISLVFKVESPWRVKWPDYKGLHRADELWRSTCFELFISRPSETAYVEINLAPGGGWNTYRFDDYRAGMRVSNDLDVTRIQGASPNFSAEIKLPGVAFPDELCLGISAVLENIDGDLTYYALGHGAVPDFHDRTQHVLVRLNGL